MTIDMRKPEDHGLGFRYRAFLDGVDVSRKCFYASEEEGVALCYIMVSRDGELRKLHGATPKPKPNAFLHGRVWAEQLIGTVELKKVA